MVFPESNPRVLTGVGIETSRAAPFPICPLLPLPQQNACESAIPQTEVIPTDTLLYLLSPKRAGLVISDGFATSVSLPGNIFQFQPDVPQQYVFPSATKQFAPAFESMLEIFFPWSESDKE
jgi:hypothetical protein